MTELITGPEHEYFYLKKTIHRIKLAVARMTAAAKQAEKNKKKSQTKLKENKLFRLMTGGLASTIGINTKNKSNSPTKSIE